MDTLLRSRRFMEQYGRSEGEQRPALHCRLRLAPQRHLRVRVKTVSTRALHRQQFQAEAAGATILLAAGQALGLGATSTTCSNLPTTKLPSVATSSETAGAVQQGPDWIDLSSSHLVAADHSQT